ncbi:hypothetical protein ACF5W4_03010 [Bacillota bacterium Lsc_1132]
MLTNIVAVPVEVGAAFYIPPPTISTFMQRMLFVTGGSDLVEVFFGH